MKEGHRTTAAHRSHTVRRESCHRMSPLCGVAAMHGSASRATDSQTAVCPPVTLTCVRLLCVLQQVTATTAATTSTKTAYLSHTLDGAGSHALQIVWHFERRICDAVRTNYVALNMAIAETHRVAFASECCGDHGRVDFAHAQTELSRGACIGIVMLIVDMCLCLAVCVCMCVCE